MNNGSTALKIMEVASELIQTHGFHAFSYRDLSDRVGIKTSSIHYHFPTKLDLAKAVIHHYHQAFLDKLDEFSKEETAKKMLQAYTDLFAETFRQGKRICLCVSLASDLNGLPEEIRNEISIFVDAHEIWLASVLKQGIDEGGFRKLENPRQAARNIFYAMEGAMLVARASSVFFPN